MTEQAPTRILRRVLEEALDTHMASSVLFEALSIAGTVPQTHEEVLQVVRSALRQVLRKRLGGDEADGIVQTIELQLTPQYDDVSTLELPLEDLARQTLRHDDTMSLPVQRRAVRVMILAAGRGFEKRVAVALGDDRAAPYTVSDDATLDSKSKEEAPAIVLVDATDFPPIDSERLKAMGTALPSTTACVVWGADLPYGKSFLKRVEGDRPWIALRLRDGIASLLDLVRSRRHSSRR